MNKKYSKRKAWLPIAELHASSNDINFHLVRRIKSKANNTVEYAYLVRYFDYRGHPYSELDYIRTTGKVLDALRIDFDSGWDEKRMIKNWKKYGTEYGELML